jgi:hypothetical protein
MEGSAARRIDAGDVLAALGALLLLVGLFLAWYDGANAWEAFETLDLVLAGWPWPRWRRRPPAQDSCAIRARSCSHHSARRCSSSCAVQLLDPPPAIATTPTSARARGSRSPVRRSS